MEQLLFKVVMAALGGGVLAIVYFGCVWLLGLVKKPALGASRDDSRNPQPPATPRTVYRAPASSPQLVRSLVIAICAVAIVAGFSASDVDLVAQPTAVAPLKVSSLPQELVFDFDGVSWVEVRDAAGKIVFVGEYPTGTRQVVDGQAPLSLWVARASVVRASYRGKVVDLRSGSREDVARLILD